MKLFSILLILFSIKTYAARSLENYNLGAGQVGLIHHVSQQAYDPVSVFPEGGSRALPGKNEISTVFKGVTYLFANIANKNLFEGDPAKYEPTYGGWCARAMIVGQKVGIDPELFTINGNRAHYFVNSRAKRFFDRDVVANEAKADQAWKELTGEEPRL